MGQQKPYEIEQGHMWSPVHWKEEMFTAIAGADGMESSSAERWVGSELSARQQSTSGTEKGTSFQEHGQ